MVVAGGSLRFRHTACVCEPGDGIWGRVRHSETPCSPLSQPSCGPRHPCTPLSMHVPTEPLTAVSGLSDMGLLGSWPGPHGWVLRAGEEKRACRAAPPQQQGPHRPPPPSPSALSSISLLGKRGGLSWGGQRDSWRPRGSSHRSLKMSPLSCPSRRTGMQTTPPHPPALHSSTPSPGTPQHSHPHWPTPLLRAGCPCRAPQHPAVQPGWVQMGVQGLVLPSCSPSPGRGQDMSPGPRTRVSPDEYGMEFGKGAG